METLETLTNAVAELETKCECLRISISNMQKLHGISVDANTALCDSYLHICDAVRKAQDALVAQILYENVLKKQEPNKLPW